MTPPPGRALVEICVGDAASAVAAADAGADRLELCADLGAGGTTPSLGTVRQVLARTTVPVRVMVRPRGGGFRYDTTHLAVMLDDVAALRETFGADRDRLGVVTGALTGDGAVDEDATARLVEAAGPLPVVFHKAFDEVPDQPRALETLAELGVAAVLTSGGAADALTGAPRLAELREQAAGRLDLVAGGGIRAHNVAEVLRRSGVDQVHLRAPATGSWPEATDPALVREVLAVLDRQASTLDRQASIRSRSS